MDDLGGTLYQGEQVLVSKDANAVVKLSDHGLGSIPDTERAMASVGLAGKEAVGGRLHLTNWRLLFPIPLVQSGEGSAEHRPPDDHRRHGRFSSSPRSCA